MLNDFLSSFAEISCTSDTAKGIYKVSYSSPTHNEDRYSVESGSVKEEAGSDIYQEKMKISSGMSLFLNFNAVILICVFIFCYAFFA